jgi:hypothetical protein
MNTSKPLQRKKCRTKAEAGETEKGGKVSTKGGNLPVDTVEIQHGESLKHFDRYAFLAFSLPSPV